MRNDTGEPQMYGALAAIRSAEIQLRWARARMFLFINALLLPPFVASADLVNPQIKPVIGGLAVALNILWLSVHARGRRWVRYWDRKLRELENLDEGQETRPRVTVFADAEFISVDGSWWNLYRQLQIVILIVLASWMVATYVQHRGTTTPRQSAAPAIFYAEISSASALS